MTTSNPLINQSKSDILPKSYPIIGSFLAISENRDRIIQWTSDILLNSPSATYVLHSLFGQQSVLTANPTNVEHILKTNFPVYQKGRSFQDTLSDLFGAGTFLADGENWKFQRQVLTQEFGKKAFLEFWENVVISELSDRLLPVLSFAAANNKILDLQDALQRFGVDTMCKIAFGYDDASLVPSLPPSQLGQAFHDSLRISNQRFNEIHPLIWKIKRLLNIGSEKLLRNGVNLVRNLINETIKKKKDEQSKNSSLASLDFLSLLLSSGHSDDTFLADMVINFILAGLESVSAVLTWYFWLIAGNPDVETELLKEMSESFDSDVPKCDEVKEMVLIHASIFESLRIYPSVPVNSRTAVDDDVLPDGTKVKKGSRVSYHSYAMGRSDNLWGEDWPVFRPRRWLERDEDAEKWKFVERDSFTNPEFHAGPRICMGKQMAIWHMMTLVAAVLRQFKVVPAVDKDFKPVFISYFNSKMQGGFPVRIEKRSAG